MGIRWTRMGVMRKVKEDEVDGMKQEVDFKDKVMHIEMSDLWFLSLTYHLAHSVLNVINASLPPIPVCVMFPKVLFLAPYFSLCTP